MRYPDVAGMWEFVQTLEGESTTRFTAELKESGEVIVRDPELNLIGVYQLNEEGDQMSLTMTNLQGYERSITTYLGAVSYEGVFGRVKQLNIDSRFVNQGTWGAAILSRQLQ